MDKKVIIDSTKWSVVSEFLSKLASPLANIFLARLLAPEVFGLVTSFTMVTAFAEIFTDSGFQKYIVQHEFEDEEELEKNINVAFIVNFIFSILIWLVIFLTRHVIGRVIGCEGYGNEIAVISLLIPLKGLSSIQNALFQRQFMFKQLAPIRFITSLIPVVVTIPLAVFFRNVWALIIGNLVKEVVMATLLTVKSTWKPKLFFRLKYLKMMFSECMWLMIDSLLIWVTAYASVFIVNHMFDAYYTGLYKTGVNTIQPYISLLYMIIHPVLFAALSRLQNDVSERNKVFYDYQRYVSYVIIPVGACVFVYGDLVTLFLLGKNWKECILLISLTGLISPINMLIGQFNSVFFRAAGKPRIAAMVQGVYCCFLVAILIWAANYDFTVLSIVGGTVNILYCVISSVALTKCSNINVLTVMKNIMPAFVSSSVMIIVVLFIRRVFPKFFISQLITVFFAIVIYITVLYIFREPRQLIKSFLRGRKKSEYS